MKTSTSPKASRKAPAKSSQPLTYRAPAPVVVPVPLPPDELAKIERLIAECRKAHDPLTFQIRTPAQYLAQAAVEKCDDWFKCLDHEAAARQLAELVYTLREEMMQAIFDLTDKTKRSRLATILADCEQYRRATGKPVAETKLENFAREMLDACPQPV